MPSTFKWIIASIIVIPQLTLGFEFEPLSCTSQLSHHFPRHQGQGCQKLSIAENTPSGLHVTTQIECHFPNQTTVHVYQQNGQIKSNLEGLTQHLDKNVTFLSLAGHGSGMHIGQLSAYTFSEITWLPILVNLETCYGGYWMYYPHYLNPSYMFIANVLHTEIPPLAVIATQAASWLSKLYKSIRSPMGDEDVFLNVDQSSKRTLGQRQKEAIEANLKRIDKWVGFEEHRYSFWRKASFAHQMFATYSIFGDGTVEF